MKLGGNLPPGQEALLVSISGTGSVIYIEIFYVSLWLYICSVWVKEPRKGPSQKYLEANEVKYFSLGGGVGDLMVTISL